MDDETYTLSRQELYNKIAPHVESVGLNKEAFLSLLAYQPGAPGTHNNGNKITDSLRLHIKLARQRGIHLSPTVIINGLVHPEVESKWTEKEWEELLSKFT
jgi:protein-disulfide isomerase